MVEISVVNDTLKIDVRGLHKLWALKSKLEVPRSAVRSVRRLADSPRAGGWLGWRMPGTYLPGVITAGTYLKHGERHFWDVVRRDRAIEIELDGHKYDRLFVEVSDPDAVVRELQPG